MLEVTVTIAIFSFIMVGVLSFIASSYQSYFKLNDRTSTLSKGRSAMERMLKEIRGARESSLGAYPINSATANEFIFYANIDSDDLTERVRYTLSGSTLSRGVIKPVGTPLQYLPANEVVSNLATDIYNGATPTFAYYDDTYTGSEAALSFPVTATNVRYVQFTLKVDETPGSPPEAVELVSSATIRNLKDNL
ncbi:MAG: hypothetical protein H6760_02050 [Candidatus Nomurabacteria bacterium]|nr:MAG: hypothetical protein H6760_02050 [Candidatus Nomurabacteria bacterium]